MTHPRSEPLTVSLTPEELDCSLKPVQHYVTAVLMLPQGFLSCNNQCYAGEHCNSCLKKKTKEHLVTTVINMKCATN